MIFHSSWRQDLNFHRGEVDEKCCNIGRAGQLRSQIKTCLRTPFALYPIPPHQHCCRRSSSVASASARTNSLAHTRMKESLHGRLLWLSLHASIFQSGSEVLIAGWRLATIACQQTSSRAEQYSPAWREYDAPARGSDDRLGSLKDAVHNNNFGRKLRNGR